MDTILKRAKEIESEIIANRRYIHQHAELNENLPVTAAFVKEKLTEMGYAVTEMSQCGLTAMCGDGNRGKVLLIRADMDALPIREENNLPFRSITENGHCCGHDMHTAMLLGAAKILKEKEAQLQGAVKFMFQPNEEGGGGAKAMLAAGILENPSVDAALAMHVDAKLPAGLMDYGMGCTFASDDSFEIVVKGRGGHGARPHESIDPINAAVHMHLALQSFIARETNPMNTVIFSIASFQAGNAFNSIPDRAVLKGSLRTYNSEVRNKAVERIREICEKTAALFGAVAEVTLVRSIPVLYNNEALTKELLQYTKQLLGETKIKTTPVVKMGSEDFAFITEKVPNSSYLFIGAGPDEQTGSEYGQHNAKVVFNESVMVQGAAVIANCAVKWLENNRK